MISIRCAALTLTGEQCKNKTNGGTLFCAVHLKQKLYQFDLERNELARVELKEYARRRKLWKKKRRRGPFPEPLPESFSSLECGARTRAGTPCKRNDIYINGRCKLHGGLSTGPKTKKGKKRSSKNRQGKKKAFTEQHHHTHGPSDETPRTLTDIIKDARRKEVSHSKPSGSRPLPE